MVVVDPVERIRRQRLRVDEVEVDVDDDDGSVGARSFEDLRARARETNLRVRVSE